MMNRKYHAVLTTLLTTLLAFTLSVSADENNETKVKQFVLDKINKQLEIEVESTASMANSKVFSCVFYKVTPWLKNEDGSKESFGGYRIMENGDDFAIIQRPENAGNNSQLISCIKDDFLLTSEDQGLLLLSAIVGLGGDSLPAENQILKSADGWQLVVGKFFDSFKGYQVKTDETGKVLEITYAMELPAI